MTNCREGGTTLETTPCLLCRIWFMNLSTLSGKFRKGFGVVGVFLLERIIAFPWHSFFLIYFYFYLMEDFVGLGIFIY